MAIEVLKTAAAAYQGRSSDAAKPVKAADSAKPKKTASEADRAAAQAAVSDTDVVKPMQPVTGNDGEKGESLGGGNGGQTSRQLQQAVEKEYDGPDRSGIRHSRGHKPCDDQNRG